MIEPVYGSSTLKRSRRTNAELAALDDAVIAAIEEDHPVSLRGVFYRVVSAGAIEKTELGYRTVSRQLVKLRRSGAVPYSRVTDGTRWITKPTTWDDIDQMLEDAGQSYRRALWNDQDTDVMVFTEKDAISGVVLPVTRKWDVPMGVLRGYCSESFAHSVAVDIADRIKGGKAVWVYNLGDHDPSRVDAWRDFRVKVAAFVDDLTDEDVLEQLRLDVLSKLIGDDDPTGTGDGALHFERLAVTPEQITDWNLPTRPTKRKDPRSNSHAGGSVEVDAIKAPVMRQLLEDAITQYVDQEALRITREAEKSEREIFLRMRGELEDDGEDDPSDEDDDEAYDPARLAAWQGLSQLLDDELEEAVQIVLNGSTDEINRLYEEDEGLYRRAIQRIEEDDRG